MYLLCSKIQIQDCKYNLSNANHKYVQHTILLHVHSPGQELVVKASHDRQESCQASESSSRLHFNICCVKPLEFQHSIWTSSCCVCRNNAGYFKQGVGTPPVVFGVKKMYMFLYFTSEHMMFSNPGLEVFVPKHNNIIRIACIANIYA